MTLEREPTIFLLSPANLNGVRARQLCARTARFDAAVAYRNGGVPIAQAFTFMSGLYFRGKITYAERFANPPAEIRDDGTLIITAGFGLVRPDWKIDESRMIRLRRTKIDHRSRSYSRAIQADLERLLDACDETTRFVLLGSIATDKYVDVIRPVIGSRLRFPAAFAGVGDMQRGSIMLHSARSGIELEYVGLDHPRSRAKK